MLIPLVNQLLGSPSTRLDGLKALEITLNECTLEVLNENATNWLIQLLKIFRSCDGGSQKVANVLGILLEGAASSAELSRQISSSIPQILGTLIDSKIKDEMLSATFDCLTIILKNFRGPCFSSKKKLEAYLLLHIDGQDQNTISALTSCYAQLPQIGGSGLKGTNHKTAWVEQANQLITRIRSSALSLLGENESDEGLSLPPLVSDDPVLRVQELGNRYKNLCLALAKMLSEPFPAPKTVPVESILNLCGDVLCLSPSSLSRRVGGATTEGRERQKVLPDLQIAALQLLTGLIVSCRKQLVPHGRTISKFSLQVLQWSRTSSHLRVPGCDRPFSKIRVAAYGVLTAWIKAAQTGSRIEKILDDLSKEFLSDIKTDKDVVTLQKTEISAKRKKGTLAYDVVKPMERRIKLNANAGVCQAALELLDRIVRSISTLTSSNFYKQIQEVILPLVLEVEAGVESAPIPFAESGLCRKSLYRVLDALVVSPHPFCPPPYSYAIAAFSHGQNDPDIEVASYCADALASCERSIHPLIPTMSFPLEHTLEPSKEPESTSTTTYLPLWDNLREIADSEEPQPKRQMLIHDITPVVAVPPVIPQPICVPKSSTPSVASSSPDHTNFDSDIDITETPMIDTVANAELSPDMPQLSPIGGETGVTVVTESFTEVVMCVEEGRESPVAPEVEEMLADFIDAPPE